MWKRGRNILRVVKIEPNMPPCVKDILNNETTLRHEVGGEIKVMYPYRDDNIGIVCRDLPVNRSEQIGELEKRDFIVSPFLFAGLSGGKLQSLTIKQIQKIMSQLELTEKKSVDAERYKSILKNSETL
jgi:hypothetical protein